MDSYVGEIRMMVTSYAPNGWHLCDGTLLRINEYEALYSLLGTTWGGDGVSNFGLPDFRGRLPVGQGQAPDMANYIVGQQTSGVETVTLQASNIPSHNHTFNVTNQPATSVTPGANLMFANAVGGDVMYVPANLAGATSPVPGENTLLPSTGGSLPHDNIMPSFPLSFIICLVGTYPTRQ